MFIFLALSALLCHVISKKNYMLLLRVPEFKKINITRETCASGASACGFARTKLRIQWKALNSELRDSGQSHATVGRPLQ